jgi:pyruvate-ferredoxin/flavodoxin oxidoreductase
MRVMDGFLPSHLDRPFHKHESDLIRQFLGAPDDLIDCPTESQRVLFGPKRRRVPKMIDLTNPVLLGPVQNQEHYMQGVVARRDNFTEPILKFFEDAYAEFARLTGRDYGLISQYRTGDADTVFVSLGSAAENIEAAVDYLREQHGARVGSIHVNVFRPFPDAAIITALAGKKRVIILERTDEPMAGDNPMGRDIRTALNKALQREAGLPAMTAATMPRLFTGVYGLGSRDFRPEHTIGAYEYATGSRARKDGKRASDGASFMILGVDHPYEVASDKTPSLLPEGSIAVRFHSIGGWGAITTGKNLGAIIGDFNDFLYERDQVVDGLGNPKEIIHVSANPKYGSEKKGAPTSYFMVAAPERIRVNCDLRHVTVVLCCDPKAFTHTNPLDGMAQGGCLVWESEEEGEQAWERLPMWARKQIIDKNIRVYTLPGFQIARKATDRADLQLRMQGNAFPAHSSPSPLLESASARAVPRGVHNSTSKSDDWARSRRPTWKSDPGVRAGARDQDREPTRPIGRHSVASALPVVQANGNGTDALRTPITDAGGGQHRTPLRARRSTLLPGLGYHQPGCASSVG